MSEGRGDIDLVGHNIIFVPNWDAQFLPPINNVIIKATKPEEKWIEDITQQIGDRRAKLRSTYMRWALAINGLEVAANKYADPKWAVENQFLVTSLRLSDDKVNVAETVITQWDGQTAADAHLKTMPMLAAFGIIDLYANLEEVIFSIYRTYLNHYPDSLLRGDEFREFRRLRRAANSDSTQRSIWEDAWQDRLNNWQRKRLYDGLAKVFKAFCDETGLKTPSVYRNTTIETWSFSINVISLVRNALVHGATTVPDELADACTQPFSLMFKFKRKEPLMISLHHLQGVDLFCEQLLDALNICLIERTDIDA
jgi:hypothetical protein